MPTSISSRLPLVVLVTLAVTAVLGTPTHASPRAADPAVTFSYGPAEIRETGDHVTWHWTVTNHSGHGVSHVVFTSKLTPQVPVTFVPAGCAVRASSTIRCEFPTMAAGTGREGDIEAGLPDDLNGPVQISGRISWENPAVKTGTGAGR